jgi:hypothetical protein
MATQNFGLYDLLVEIIPGSVSILLIASVLPTDTGYVRIFFQSGITQGVLFIILSWIIGHFIQALASKIDSAVIERREHSKPFESKIQEADLDSEEFSVQNSFLQNAYSTFDNELSNTELFFIVQSYLWNTQLGRMVRFQSLYTAFRSLWVLFAIGALVHVLLFAAPILNYPIRWNHAELAVIVLSLVSAACLSYYLRLKFHREMVDAMINDFLADVLSKQNP